MLTIPQPEANLNGWKSGHAPTFVQRQPSPFGRSRELLGNGPAFRSLHFKPSLFGAGMTVASRRVP